MESGCGGKMEIINLPFEEKALPFLLNIRKNYATF